MPVRIAIIGCGNRGADVYARHLTEQGAIISYLAEPKPERLRKVAARFDVPAAQCFMNWEDLLASSPDTDAVVVATPDGTHIAPAIAALQGGFDVLLEKPIAETPEELWRLAAAEQASAGSVSVCHVLRATPFFRAVHEVVAAGRLGQLVSVQINENVAYWHYAHSYVRGNWRESPPAAPFILAKSSHDLDLLRWLAGAPPQQVSSFGSLHHFRPEHKPAGAAQRCLDCRVSNCAYDARRIYLSRPADEWPVTVLTAGGLNVAEALRTTRYGECVYLGKNNVCDHQQVGVQFAGGVQATLTTSAFTHNNTRTIKLLGSRGELRGQMEQGELELHDFSLGGTKGAVQRWSVEANGNHGGGDRELVRGWLAYLSGEAPVPTPLAESLDSHLMAFAAEQSRLSGQVVNLGGSAGPISPESA